MALKDGLETFARNPTGAAGQGIRNDFATVADAVDTKQTILLEGPFVDGDKTKLNGIEAGADITDPTNVRAAGALMESDLADPAAVKAFDPADYATAAQGSLADSAVQPGANVSLLVNDAGYLTDITNGLFNDLADVNIPNPGAGQDGFSVVWDNATGTYVLQDVSGGAVAWGSITGTLSNQTDLQTALDGKEDSFTKNTGFNKDFGTTAGTVSEGNHTHVKVDITDFNDADYATAAQGALADSSVQPGDGNSILINDSGFIADITAEVFNDLADVNIPSPGAGQDGYAVTWDNASGRYILQNISGGASAFTDLTDTPSTYAGQQGKLVRVNATETGLIFGDPSGTSVSWGDILGTLSDQTDLQGELDGKENAFTKNTGFNKNFGNSAGTVAEGNHTHTKTDITDFSDADYATAAQGALADSAAQPGDNISIFTNDSGFIADITSESIGSLFDVEITTPALRHALMHDGVDSWDNRLLVKADVSDFNDGDYATAAQGALADSAMQPGDDNALLTNGAGYITDITSEVFNDLFDVNIPSPGAGQDGFSVTWDNSSGRYILADVSGGATVWGTITGTLSNQADLQAELDAKLGEVPDDQNRTYFRRRSGATGEYTKELKGYAETTQATLTTNTGPGEDLAADDGNVIVSNLTGSYFLNSLSQSLTYMPVTWMLQHNGFNVTFPANFIFPGGTPPSTATGNALTLGLMPAGANWRVHYVEDFAS